MPARARRPAVVARLARTLGPATIPHSSIAANFDGQHGKASVATFATVRTSDSTAEHHCKPEGKANADSGVSFVTSEARQGAWRVPTVLPHGREESKLHVMATAAEAQSRLKAARHYAHHPRQKSRFLSARCHCAALLAAQLINRLNSRAASIAQLRHAGPNPSYKPSTNGVPRGPGRRYVVHFRHPGPRVTPLVPS